MSETGKRWLKLDNAAKIYPAAQNRMWTAMFRESVTLKEPVDNKILEQALRDTLSRLPSFAVSLHKGVFWYYLEQLDGAPPVCEDARNPCSKLEPRHNGGFQLRVRYFDRRIAVEFMHTLADGMGGMTFLKTLTARYLELKYGASIPKGAQILDCADAPAPEEMEDSFLKNTGRMSASRHEANSFRIKGTHELDRFLNVTTGIVDSSLIHSKAREKGVSVTEYTASVLIMAIARIERKTLPHKRKPPVIKVSLPVNLRRIFPSRTLRNFASYINVGIDPAFGEYTFDEILSIVHHQMGIELNEKSLRAKFTANVQTEKNIAMRIMPLFIKNIAMKLAFNLVGDIKTSTTISNLGVITVPPEMAAYVERMDFLLGPLSKNPVACGAVTYNGKLYLNFTRTIEESVVEREFFTSLVKLGIPVLIESNRRENECLTV